MCVCVCVYLCICACEYIYICLCQGVHTRVPAYVYEITSAHRLIFSFQLLEKSSTIHLVEGGPEVTLDVRFWANRSVICDGIAPATECRVTLNVSIAGGIYSSPMYVLIVSNAF